MSRSAFSLLELLVVIGVIGVLAGLLFPALSVAKSKARRISCVSNLHHLGIAGMLYWDDHEGRAFRYRGEANDGGDLYWFGWIQRGAEGERGFDGDQGKLAAYIGKSGVRICPSLNYLSSTYKLKATGASFGYGYNLHLSPASGPEPEVNVNSVERPVETAFLADAGQVNTWQSPASDTNPMMEEFYYVSAFESTTHFRHAKVANIVYIDGHVDAREPVEGTEDVRVPGELTGRLPSRVLIP